MSLLGLAAKNLGRNKARTGLTVAGVAIAILAFALIQTAVRSWELQVELAAKDRLVSRHKVTFVMQLPKLYVEEVRQVPGVKEASWANWFGGQYPGHETDFFPTLAVEPESYFKVYDEFGLTKEEHDAWMADRQGAVIGDVLATKFGWKVGDEVTLASPIFPGEWRFHIKAIYKAVRKSANRDGFLFNWVYLNENAPERMREKVGWIGARALPGIAPADLSKTIDAHFDVKDVQTVTQDEGTFNQGFMGMFATVLQALNIVSLIILGIMILILGNTVAMGVRERTREYGVLQAVGFRPGHVAVLVLGESLTLGLLGGLAGLAASYALINGVMGPFIEVNMSAMFMVFRVGATTASAALAIAVFLGLAAGALPVLSVRGLKVVDALRHTA